MFLFPSSNSYAPRKASDICGTNAITTTAIAAAIKNGHTPLTTSEKLVFAVDAAVNRLSPKGGVIKPTTRHTQNTAPKWTGLIPSSMPMGTRIGPRMTILESVSIIQPTKNRISINMIKYDTRLFRYGITAFALYLLEFTGKSNETDSHEFSKLKAAICLVILGIVLIAMSVNSSSFPMHLVATAGALIMILTGCIKEHEAYKAIDWSTIFIVGGMSAVSKAMDVSGAGLIISNGAIHFLGEHPSKIAVLFVIFILTCFLTNIMMNTSTALLVTPLFIPIAFALNINPAAIAVAICVAASCPFLTPVGSGTNTLVVRPGNLGFMDFFKPGLGMTVVITVVSMIFIPIIWPL